MWKKDPKLNVWVEFNRSGSKTGMHVGISSEIQADPNAKWEKYPRSNIGGMRRVSPCIRFVAYSAVPSWGNGGHYTQYHEIFVAWNRTPKQSEQPYQKYMKDAIKKNFIGVHKSISPIKTALKKWMGNN